jgi:hypothetical protein
MIDDIKRPEPVNKRPASDDYKIGALLKIWWRLLKTILKQLGRKVLIEPLIKDKKPTANSNNPIPSAVAQSIPFPVYYPSSLPVGFKINPSSISNRGQILTYYYEYDGGKKLIITEQAKPPNFDFGKLSGDQEFTAPLGRAYIVDMDTRTTGSLITDKTWVILNAPNKMGADQLRQIIDSFSKVY